MDELDELRLKIMHFRYGWLIPTDKQDKLRFFDHYERSEEIPNFSRFIEHAWNLVDDARAEGYEVYLSCVKNIYTLCIMENTGEPPINSLNEIARGYGQTAPEAISRAWLAWKEANG
jgi:hypothetical protein